MKNHVLLSKVSELLIPTSKVWDNVESKDK